ncbi:hypothetical protein BGZ52_010202 [Haplosporangium bisporale]|nr:hypothetical protein BGZ52_010202 [Haplosporangium bisporale]
MNDNQWDLPEILMIIGSFLGQRDLARCSMVCKAWQHSFYPLIWRNIVRTLRRSPPMMLIHKNAQHIRSLKYDFFQLGLEPDLSEDLCRLERLVLPGSVMQTSLGNTPLLKALASTNEAVPVHLSQSPCHDRSGVWDYFTRMIRQNQKTLQVLSIEGYLTSYSTLPTYDFWSAIAGCSSRLRTLRIKSDRQISLSTLHMLWRMTCDHLETFDVDGYSVLHGGKLRDLQEQDNEEETKEPSIQHIRLTNFQYVHPQEMLETWILPCRKLKTLVWKVDVPHFSPEWDTESAPEYWPQLESIEITSERSRKINDKQLAAILSRARKRGAGENRGGLVRLDLRGTGCGESSWQVLRTTGTSRTNIDTLQLRPVLSHFQTLTELDVTHCMDVGSVMVQEVLSSCPVLRSIAANSIHILDIAAGDPWVCLGLKSWSVFINISSNHGMDMTSVKTDKLNDLQPLVYQHLARLTELQTLNFDYKPPLPRQSHQSSTQLPTLDWQLKRGLDALSSLTKLRNLHFLKGNRMGMTTSSAKWMIENWVVKGPIKLESVEGRLGRQKTEERAIGKMFREHGVHVPILG